MENPDWLEFVIQAKKVIEKLEAVKPLHGAIYELHAPLLNGMVRYVTDNKKVTRVHWNELDQAKRMVAPYEQSRHDKDRKR